MKIRLTYADRLKIEQFAKRSICDSQIARELGRCPSVIHREFKRTGGKETYSAERGEEIARVGRKRVFVPKQEKVLNSLLGRVTITVPTVTIEDRIKKLEGQLDRIRSNLGELCEYLNQQVNFSYQ